jgi:hypothetical protein
MERFLAPSHFNPEYRNSMDFGKIGIMVLPPSAQCKDPRYG